MATVLYSAGLSGVPSWRWRWWMITWRQVPPGTMTLSQMDPDSRPSPITLETSRFGTSVLSGPCRYEIQGFCWAARQASFPRYRAQDALPSWQGRKWRVLYPDNTLSSPLPLIPPPPRAWDWRRAVFAPDSWRNGAWFLITNSSSLKCH